MRFNAELVARAWVILGSLIVGVKIIYWSVIHDLYVPFMKLTVGVAGLLEGQLKHFLESQLKHCEARYLKLEGTTYNYF